ncbi:MAG: GNAT family N-acetyltransferase [Rhodobacteraceae bacterium]|nr:GNAT family N-acetyltransferase [Paracoccaceae bacterium]
MTLPGAPDIYAAIEATWPPAATDRVGPWTIRHGAGGGKRVSAVTLEGAFDALPDAEAAMRDLGQTPLVMVREGEALLDASLESLGYAVIDPVTLYVVRATEIATPAPRMVAFEVWLPLAIMADLWADGGIGAGRLEVMERVQGPKTALFGRAQNRPAACAFVACAKDIAMIHALEVAPAMRRIGMGATLTRAAADWAARQGATWLALAVTTANSGANALYSGLGMQAVGQYHYRIKEDA